LLSSFGFGDFCLTFEPITIEVLVHIQTIFGLYWSKGEKKGNRKETEQILAARFFGCFFWREADNWELNNLSRE
jgi:hypothetical protein